MDLRLGIDDTARFATASASEQQVLQSRREMLHQSGLLREHPLLGDEDWQAVRAFYQSEAPLTLGSPNRRGSIPRELPLFKEKTHRYRPSGALTSLIRIRPEFSQILVGDSRRGALSLHDSDMNPIVEYDASDAMWVDAEFDPEGVYLLSIGDLAGDFVGQSLRRVLRGINDGSIFVPQGEALGGLYRPADLTRGDLDGDGKPEMVVSSFGIETGTVSVHGIETTDGLLTENPLAILYDGPGAVQSEVHDFNGDGRMDVAVLISDAREGLTLFLNEGDFTFSARPVIKAHAAFGFVAFALHDVNEDGRTDIITVNGDNVDSDPYNTIKPYHGVRVYLQNGDGNFTESYFFALPGAYGVEVEDFDDDGDADLAVIAFNPDFANPLPEGFVFLEQRRPMEFQASTHPATSSGRWLTMDAGDFDDDGDVDLALGGGYVPAGLLPDHPAVWRRHTSYGPAVLLLENQTNP